MRRCDPEEHCLGCGCILDADEQYRSRYLEANKVRDLELWLCDRCLAVRRDDNDARHDATVVALHQSEDEGTFDC